MVYITVEWIALPINDRLCCVKALIGKYHAIFIQVVPFPDCHHGLSYGMVLHNYVHEKIITK